MKVTNELSQMRLYEMSNQSKIAFPVDLSGGDYLNVDVSGLLRITGGIDVYD